MKNQAFTLIELLVVVLIIGILAAIAVPQYQKAVYKSRLTQLTSGVNIAKKVVDIYLLSNGYPQVWGPLFGSGRIGNTDIDLPGNCNFHHSCFSNAGALEVFCGPDYCGIYMYMNYNENGSSGNSILGGGDCILTQYPGDKWYVSSLKYITANKQPALFCQWLKDNVELATASVKEVCAEYGVELSLYE